MKRHSIDGTVFGLVCFFPEGTYLISDTVSCQEQVKKLDRQRQTDSFGATWLSWLVVKLNTAKNGCP